MCLHARRPGRVARRSEQGRADDAKPVIDADSGAEVITLLFEMNREFGTTLVLVTHDEGLARRCSRIVRLAAGRIVS